MKTPTEQAHAPVVNVEIRPVTLSDADAMAALVSHLGYPATAAEMHTRLSHLSTKAEYRTFIAAASGQVVGMVGVYVGYALEFDGCYGRLTGLAVEPDSQRQGIGRLLMEHVENWLATQGATLLTLTSGSHRQEAHEFYRGLGYEQTGVRFTKRL